MNINDKLIENLCNLILQENHKEKLTEFSMSKKKVYNR